jgi:hypothetical protein
VRVGTGSPNSARTFRPAGETVHSSRAETCAGMGATAPVFRTVYEGLRPKQPGALAPIGIVQSARRLRKATKRANPPPPDFPPAAL